MCHLTYQIAVSWLIFKYIDEQSLPFQSENIVQQEVKLLRNEVKRFNDRVVEEQWKNEDDLDNMTITSIAVLDDTVNDDIDD